MAQVKVPAEVAQRLQGNKNFSDYAREMMQYVTSNQSRFPVGSRERTYFEKQEKFLARQLWYLEGRQDANGDIADLLLFNNMRRAGRLNVWKPLRMAVGVS